MNYYICLSKLNEKIRFQPARRFGRRTGILLHYTCKLINKESYCSECGSKVIKFANDFLANQNVPLITNHYADRTDLHTMEHQLLTIRQVKTTSIQLCNEVNKYLTKILNKINCIERIHMPYKNSFITIK